MRIALAIFAVALGAMPEIAQSHEQFYGYQARQPDNWAAHEDEHAAEHAARDAQRDAWHARRDAEMGDFEGAAEAEQRSREEWEHAGHHAHAAQHERTHYGDNRTDPY